MNFTLVMSASIKVNPNGLYHVSEQSLMDRQRQYAETLSFYIRQPCIKKILFVENSNADLAYLKQLAGAREKVEFLSLDLNNYPGKWGKGYGEFLLLDKAVDWLCAHSCDVMVKVTGRFPILNISSMIEEFSSRENLSLAVDVIDHHVYDWIRSGSTGHSCRTIIFAVSTEFYKKHIYGRYASNPEAYRGAEHFMYGIWQATRNIVDEGVVYPRFHHEPRLSGYAGGVASGSFFFSGNYDGWKNRMKRTLRQLCRWCIPWLWI